jgi:imidazolonepropionase
MLRVLTRLAESHQIRSRRRSGRTQLPVEFRERRRAYIDLILREIPAVAGERLAEWCDVFCEAAGMKLRIHADELSPSGGSAVAADLGVRSADHLISSTSLTRPTSPPARSSPPCCRQPPFI